MSDVMVFPEMSCWHRLVILHYLTIEDAVTVAEILLEKITREEIA